MHDFPFISFSMKPITSSIVVIVHVSLLPLGIGKTVKEKVCVHTSRDIRAIASQLVSVWVELFRKEKASKGLKLLRQSTLDSKSKSPVVSGKPPLRVHHVESKGQYPSTISTKTLIDEPGQLGTRINPKSEAQLSNSNGSSRNVMEEEDREVLLSEEEKAAFAAAEAARAAAIAAAKVCFLIFLQHSYFIIVSLTLLGFHICWIWIN